MWSISKGKVSPKLFLGVGLVQTPNLYLLMPVFYITSRALILSLLIQSGNSDGNPSCYNLCCSSGLILLLPVIDYIDGSRTGQSWVHNFTLYQSRYSGSVYKHCLWTGALGSGCWVLPDGNWVSKSLEILCYLMKVVTGVITPQLLRLGTR